MSRLLVVLVSFVAGCFFGFIAGSTPQHNGADVAFIICLVVFLFASAPIATKTYRFTRTPPQ